jgi:hypothetical protein
MDPATLALLFGCGALLGYAGKSEVEQDREDKTITLKAIYRWDRWLANELLSREALRLTGQIFDLDLLRWWPGVRTGLSKVVAVTQVNGPLKCHFVVVLERGGEFGWIFSEGYKAGYRQISGQENFNRIRAILEKLNTNPAKTVIQTAKGIKNDQERWEYMSKAMDLKRNVGLTVLLSKDPDFADLVFTTALTVKPEVAARMQEKRVEEGQPPLLEERLPAEFERAPERQRARAAVSP